MRPEDMLLYFPEDMETPERLEERAHREAMRLTKITHDLRRAMQACQQARVGRIPGDSAELGNAAVAIRKALQYLERGV